MVCSKAKRPFRGKKHEHAPSDDSISVSDGSTVSSISDYSISDDSFSDESSTSGDSISHDSSNYSDDNESTPEVVPDPLGNSPALPGPSRVSFGEPQSSTGRGALPRPKVKRLSFSASSTVTTGEQMKKVVQAVGNILKSCLKQPGSKSKKMSVRFQEDQNEVFEIDNEDDESDDQSMDYSFTPSPSSSSDSFSSNADDTMPSTSETPKSKICREPSDWDDSESDDNHIVTISESLGSLNCLDDDVKSSNCTLQTNTSAVTFDNGSPQQGQPKSTSSTPDLDTNFNETSSQVDAAGSSKSRPADTGSKSNFKKPKSVKLPDWGGPASLSDLVKVTDIHQSTSAPKPRPGRSVRFPVDGSKKTESCTSTDKSQAKTKTRRSLGHWDSKFMGFKRSKDVKAASPAIQSAPQPVAQQVSDSCSSTKQNCDQSLKRKRDSELEFTIRKPQGPAKRQKTCSDSDSNQPGSS